MELTVTVTIRGVNFSFQTDSEGKNVSEVIEVIRKIYETHKTEFGLLPIEAVKRGPSAKYVERLSVKDLLIPQDTLTLIVTKNKKMSNWGILLTLLYYSQTPLTYEDIMRLSEELGKPIKYSWLNTEFHRRDKEGLVRAMEIPNTKKKAYKLTELGIMRAKEILTKLAKT